MNSLRQAVVLYLEVKAKFNDRTKVGARIRDSVNANHTDSGHGKGPISMSVFRVAEARKNGIELQE
jgi:hypothetical protein